MKSFIARIADWIVKPVKPVSQQSMMIMCCVNLLQTSGRK